MAIYRGRLDPEKTKPHQGILVAIFDVNGDRVGLDSSNGDGIYSFTGLYTGWHRVKFTGGNYTEEDSVDVFVSAAAGDPDSIGRFTDTPILSVEEKSYTILPNSKDLTDERISAITQVGITNLELAQGVLTDVVIHYRANIPSFVNLNGLSIVCVGDDITKGVDTGAGEDYPAKLQTLIAGGTTVTNKGVNGSTLTTTNPATSYREKTEYQEALDLDADIVIIGLGIHDADD